MPPFTRLLIPRPILDAVLVHARAEVPNECCGLLAGVIEEGVGQVTQQFPIRNNLASPTEYSTNPRDMLDASKATRAAGTEVLVIYHSHPTSEPVPSRRDIERNWWGEGVAHLIIGLSREEPDVRAWWITEGGYRVALWDSP
jgi:proteasome lid subunit RPN8/RPN11